MKHGLIFLGGLIAGVYLFSVMLPQTTFGQAAATWIPSSGYLKPFSSTIGVRITSLGSSGDPCVKIDDTSGTLATTTCGSGGGDGLATTSIDTEAELESVVTDVDNFFTENDTGFVSSSSLNLANWANGRLLVASTTADGGFDWLATTSAYIGLVQFSDLHNAVTLAGEDFLSLSTQQITANAINPDNLASADFGDFTCNGTNCALDATYLTDITGESIFDLSDVAGASAASGTLFVSDGTNFNAQATATLGLFGDLADFTGTLTDTKICTYDEAGGEIDCDYTDISSGGTGIATSGPIADTEIIYATAVGTVDSEAAFTYDDATNVLTTDYLTVDGTFGVATSSFSHNVKIGGGSSGANVLELDIPSGFDPSASESVGGVVNLNLGTSDEIGFAGYTNTTGTNRLMSLVCDAATYGGNCFHVRNDGTETALNVLGSPTGKGIAKIGSNGVGDADASGLSIDTSLASFIGQGIFLKGNASGKLLNFRGSDDTEHLTLLPGGNLGLGSTSPDSVLSVTGTTTSDYANILSGINLFGGGTKTTANALCVQLTGSADLCDGGDAEGAGSSPFTDEGTVIASTNGESIRVNFIEATSTTATSTFAGSVQLEASNGMAGNNINEGLLGLWMNENRGSAISLHSSSTAQAGDGEILHIEQYNASHANEILKIENSSTQGGSEEIYIVSPTPDIALCDDTDANNDCQEIEVTSNGEIVFNSRNTADTSFERNVIFAPYRTGGQVGIGTAFDTTFLDAVFTIVPTTTLTDAFHISSVSDAGGDLFTIDSSGNVTSAGSFTGTTLDTGQGANELYDMDQNVLTSSDVQFSQLSLGKAGATNVSLDLLLNSATTTGLRAEADASTRTILSGYVTGDSQVRALLRADGLLAMGDGSTAADTNIFRNAANVLRTNDSLIVDGTATVTTALAVKGEPVNGTTTRSFNIASTTKDGSGNSFDSATTSIVLEIVAEPKTLTLFRCQATTTGSVSVRFGDGTNWTNSGSCSTGDSYALTSNNSFTVGESLIVQVGTSASSPSRVTVTVAENKDI